MGLSNLQDQFLLLRQGATPEEILWITKQKILEKYVNTKEKKESMDYTIRSEINIK